MKNHALTFLRTLSNIPKPSSNSSLAKWTRVTRYLCHTALVENQSCFTIPSAETIAASLPLTTNQVRETRAFRIFVHKLYVSFLDIFRVVVSSRARVVIITSVSLLRFLSFPFYFFFFFTTTASTFIGWIRNGAIPWINLPHMFPSIVASSYCCT